MDKDEKRIVDVARKYASLTKVNKDNLSALNKCKIALRDELVDYLRKNQLPVGSKVRVDNMLMSYGPTVSESIKPRAWLDLLYKGKITEDQFLSAISVGKGEASRIIGHDQVLHISANKIGSRSDIRLEVDKNSHIDEFSVIQPRTIRLKRTANPDSNFLGVKRKIKIGVRHDSR